jgi:hypothetical protein
MCPVPAPAVTVAATVLAGSRVYAYGGLVNDPVRVMLFGPQPV